MLLLEHSASTICRVAHLPCFACAAYVVQLQRACEATAHELATVTTDKVALQQQYKQSQESIDALAAELQETLAKVDEKETQVEALVEQLDAEQAENKVAAQKVSMFRRVTHCHCMLCMLCN